MDYAVTARRLRARHFDEKRKQRIFNPFVRNIGIDKDALDKQVQEKKMLRDQEQINNQEFSNKLLQDCAISLKLEEQNKKKQKAVDLEIVDFRKKFQAPETRREYDIHDPLGNKKGQPSRIDDNDPRVTLSSGQRFAGEKGLTKEQRVEQMLQQRKWLDMQICEKKTLKEENKKAEHTWKEFEHTTAQRALALASLEKECKNKLNEANFRYNQALAAEQNMNKNIANTENAEDKMAEVYNAITGNFLTENPELGFNNALCPGRIAPTQYKGLTPAMKQALYDEQARQREELKRRREAIEKQEEDWSKMLNMLTRHGTLNEQEMQRKKKNLEDKIKEFNLVLADEQKNNQEFLNNVLYRTKTSDKFYEQFNTTSR